MMKLCSVTVWYNPTQLYVNNILTYSKLMEKCYILDNSNNDNSLLAKQIPNSVYIPNFDNLGIARALNIGCEKAINDGFEWCMTMDQDSSWETDELIKLLAFVSNDKSETNVSFGPNPIFKQEISFLEKTTSFLMNKDVKESNNNISDVEYFDVDRVICSGNIINLPVWEKIGKFYEPLFIDEVDYEFCYRLVDNGFHIKRLNNAMMFHNLGNPKKTFYPMSTFHLGKRLYYICRNRLLLEKMYPKYAEKYSYRRSVRGRIRGCFFNLYWNQFKYIRRAYYDAKHNRLGKYESLWLKKD